MQPNIPEPLYALYSDTKRDIKGTTIDLALRSLLNLVQLNFCTCLLDKGHEGWTVVDNLTLDNLRQRCNGYLNSSYMGYPDVEEYWFKITDKGLIEESKDIYDEYYPDI